MNTHRLRTLCCFVLLIVALCAVSGLPAQAQTGFGTVERVSVSSTGEESYADSYEPAITPDGRYVAFESYAPNLVSGDTNGMVDIFVHDRQTGQTTRVSVSSSGGQADNYSNYPAITDDGRYVAFQSSATNLVAADTNGSWDIFVHDRQTGETTCISVSPTGEIGNNHTFDPQMTGDGHYVVFWGPAGNLVAGDANGKGDVFVRDMQAGQTFLVSVSTAGVQGNQGSSSADISDDGRYVAFNSWASNLITGDTNNKGDVFIRDRQTAETTRMAGDSDFPSISGDGRYVAFYSPSSQVAGDSNGWSDIFVLDRQTGEMTAVSVNPSGVTGNGSSYRPDITDDGRYVAFESVANDLVAGDSGAGYDVFVRDRQTEQTRRVSVNEAGQPGSGIQAAITNDGRYVAFSSDDPTLVPGDTNEIYDVFVQDRDGVAGAPTVTGFTPTSGPVGTSVTINGTNLSGATAVTFNGTNQPTFTVVSATQITAAVPAGATTGAIAVTTAVDTATSATNFTVTAPAPTVTGFTPTSGPVGTSVTINGTNFTGATNVKFNTTNQPAFTVVSATQITAAVPAGATTGKISVTTPGGTGQSATNFTVIGAPTITSFTPTSGPVGTSVTINGTNFTGATAVTFNGSNQPAFTVNSATKITAAVPTGATTGKISVTAPGGTATSAGDFTVTIVTATAIYLSPSGTGTLGGKAVTGADILAYVQATNTWDVLYDGSYVNTTKNVDAFAFDGDDILLSFAANQVIAGVGTFAGQDIARFTPTSLGYNNTAGSFVWAFDGSDVGLTTSAENIDVLWIDSQGRLYISTTGTAKVTGAGGTITAHDEDVLRFTPTALGANTTGTWALYWDATPIAGMGVEDIGGYWEDANGDRYVTIAGAFTLGSVKGNGKSIVKFTPSGGSWTPSLVSWLAQGATFPTNLDGIEMAR